MANARRQHLLEPPPPAGALLERRSSGLPPDAAIERVNRLGYQPSTSKRLMVISNLMLLCEGSTPRRCSVVHGALLDSYEWVDGAERVRQMGQMSDGGHLCHQALHRRLQLTSLKWATQTRPWCEILGWPLLGASLTPPHLLRATPPLEMVSLLDKMDPERPSWLKRCAELSWRAPTVWP